MDHSKMVNTSTCIASEPILPNGQCPSHKRENTSWPNEGEDASRKERFIAMKAIGIIIGIIVILLIGFFGGQVLLGTGAGVGVATGLVVGSQAGICLAVQTAQDQGLLGAEQADQVIKKSVGEISKGSKFKESESFQWITGQKDCSDMIAKLKEAHER